MEPLGGEDGLEEERSTNPTSGEQSTIIDSLQPWTFDLQTNPSNNRSENPTLTVKFNTRVEMRGLKLQGSTDGNEVVAFMLSFLDGESQTFEDVSDSSNEPSVSENNLYCICINT